MTTLDDLLLSSNTNRECFYSGIDSRDQCDDNEWFDQYPYSVSYNFNSRGFRDDEWPTSRGELQNAIWCFGDSFTVGLGSPRTHTWPYVLQTRSGKRTINISMDGASNDWISRRALQVKNEINPSNIVIMWSFLHRREASSPALSMSDEFRRIWNTKCSPSEDLKNFKNCVAPLKLLGIQHYIVPNPNQYSQLLDIWNQVSGPDWPQRPATVKEFLQLPKFVVSEMKEFSVYKKLRTAVETDEPFNQICAELNVNKVKSVDRARDGYHFDIVTSNMLVDSMLQHIV